jgi:hypothetical protein
MGESVSILRTIGSVKAAVVLLAAIAVACLVATLLPQAPANHYVYRANWFLGLLGAFSVNLACCTIRRYRSGPRRFASVVTHVSILLVVAGAIVDGVWGERGILQLAIGESASSFQADVGEKALPFTVHLADFRVERHPPAVALSLGETKAGAVFDQSLVLSAGSESALAKSGWALRADAVQENLERWPRVAPAPPGMGTLGVRLRFGGAGHDVCEESLLAGERNEIQVADHSWRALLNRFPDAETRDRAVEALRPVTGNGFVELAGSAGAAPVRLDAHPGQKQTTADGTTVEVLRYVPHFVMVGGVVRSQTEQPVNPAVQLRFTRADGNRHDRWLFARFPDVHPMPGKDAGVVARYVRSADIDFRHQLFLFAVPDGDLVYAVVSPGQADIVRGRGTAGTRITFAGEDGFAEIAEILPQAVLASGVRSTAPGEGQPGVRLQLLRAGQPAGTPVWLLRGDEPTALGDSGLAAVMTGCAARIKAFRSVVQIVEGGRVVREATVEVNRPLTYRGYSFYQASYDQEGERWSGLEIARSPGVPLVYAGFLLFVAGLVAGLYIQPWLLRGSDTSAEAKP